MATAAVAVMNMATKAAVAVVVVAMGAVAVMSTVLSREEAMEAVEVEADSGKKAAKAIISIIVGRKRRAMVVVVVVVWVVEEEMITVGKEEEWVVVWVGEMIMVGKEEEWVEEWAVDVKSKAMEVVGWVGEMTMVDKEEVWVVVWEEAWEDKTTTTPKAVPPATVVSAVTSNQNSVVEQPEDTAIKHPDASLAQAVMAKDTLVLKPPTAATKANSAVPWLTRSCTLAALGIPLCSRTPWGICRTSISRTVGRALMRVPLSMRIRLCMVANKLKVVETITARLSVRARRCKR